MTEENPMPVYEFECPAGHVTESIERIGTRTVDCLKCPALVMQTAPAKLVRQKARRILSPTRTTFVFADTMRGQKVPRG